MNDDDLSDPSVDEDGVSLSHCYGLHEKLQRLDAQFRAIPITDRGPECLRQYALASLAAVCETVDFQATIFSHLSEALTLANEGRRHPIMAVNAHELARSRPANSILAIQGSAAGALEYAFTNLGIRQRDAAKRIADFIASAGFAKSDGRPYTAGQHRQVAHSMHYPQPCGVATLR